MTSRRAWLAAAAIGGWVFSRVWRTAQEMRADRSRSDGGRPGDADGWVPAAPWT